MAKQNMKKPQQDLNQNVEQSGRVDAGEVNHDLPEGNLGESIGGEDSQASVRRIGQDEGKGSQGFGNE